VAIVQPSTLESLVQRVFYAQPRFSLIVLGMFASTGLALVVLGVYGVLAYTVSQQGREIAIRMALGGDRRHVLKHVFRMGLQLLGTGVVIGLAASMATNRLLVNQLWRTSPYDPVILTAVTVIVVGVGLCACWVPARRAVRVEPIAALRHE
jgi:putative ABC transport system permease protein